MLLNICVLWVTKIKQGDASVFYVRKYKLASALVVDSKLNYLPYKDYSRVSSIVEIESTLLQVFKLQSSKATNSYWSLFGIVLKRMNT